MSYCCFQQENRCVWCSWVAFSDQNSPETLTFSLKTVVLDLWKIQVKTCVSCVRCTVVFLPEIWIFFMKKQKNQHIFDPKSIDLKCDFGKSVDLDWELKIHRLLNRKSFRFKVFLWNFMNFGSESGILKKINTFWISDRGFKVWFCKIRGSWSSENFTACSIANRQI